jgi:energy-converting hydrogenase Eha subunit B
MTTDITPPRSGRRTLMLLVAAALVGAVAAALVAALLVNISNRQHEGLIPFFRVV